MWRLTAGFGHVCDSEFVYILSTMNSPLFKVVIFYITGILCGRWVSLDMGILILICSGLAYISIRIHWDFGRRISFYLLVVLSGAIGIMVKMSPISPADLRNSLPAFEIIGSVTGKIVRVDEMDVEDGTRRRRANLLIAVDKLNTTLQPEWFKSRGLISATTDSLPWNQDQQKNSWKDLVGATITAHGVILPVRPEHHFASIPKSQYLKSRGCFFKINTAGQGWLRVMEKSDSPGSLLHRLRQAILGSARDRLAWSFPQDDRHRRLMLALSLGIRENLKSEDTDAFQRTGTMHIFAISGLHVGIIAMILFQALSFFIWSRSWAAGISIPAIWMYVWIIGMPASATRAAIMATVVLAGICLRRPDHWPNTLHLTALIHLLVDPAQLFQPGFLLSFAAVFWIILIMPRTQHWVARLRSPDPLLPREWTPWHWRWIHQCAAHLASLALLSLVCWLGTLPLIAFNFGQVSWSGLILNIALVPMAGLCLLNLMLGFATGWSMGWIDGAYFHGAWFIMKAMVAISDYASGLPGIVWIPQTRLAIYWVVYYVWLLTAGLFWGTTYRWWRFTWFGAGAILALFFFWDGRLDQPADIRSTVVGSSQVITIDQPGIPLIQIHCGSEFSAPVFENLQIAPQSPRMLILTHASNRLMGGLPYFLNQVKPLRIFADLDQDFRSPAWRQVQAVRGEVPVGSLNLAPLEEWGLDLLWPPANPENTNEFLNRASDLGVVLRWHNPHHSLLICPPLSPQAQLEILNSVSIPTTEGILCTMDSAAVALESWFIQAFQPDWVVVADGSPPSPVHFKDRNFIPWKSALHPIRCWRQSDFGDWLIQFHDTGFTQHLSASQSFDAIKSSSKQSR